MRTVAVFQTMTLAQQGARLLTGAAIPAQVVRVDAARTRRGCSWGVAFPSRLIANVRGVFSDAGISVREYLPEEVGYGLS